MAKTFSRQAREAVHEAQNGYCAVNDCHEKICDFHHVVPNSKENQRRYPLFLQSPFNCVGICRADHDSGKIYKFKISLKLADLYESWLEKLITMVI